MAPMLDWCIYNYLATLFPFWNSLFIAMRYSKLLIVMIKFEYSLQIDSVADVTIGIKQMA